MVCDDKAMIYAKKNKDLKGYYISYVANARRLSYLGKMKESNDRIIKEINNISDLETKAVALLAITTNYKDLGDRSHSLDKYYLEAINNLRNTTYKNLLNSAIHEYANYLLEKGAFKETLIYADSINYFSKTENAIAITNYLKSRAFYEMKAYDKALRCINTAIKLDTKNYDAYYLLDDYKVRGKIFLEENNIQLAIKDFKKAKDLFKEAQDKLLETEVLKYNLLANLKLKDKYLFDDFEKYVNLKDSIYDKSQSQTMMQYEAEYKSIEKEAKIKQQELLIEKEKFNKYIAFGSIGFLILLSGGGYFSFSSKQKQTQLETENTLLGLQQNINAMALQNLNQQLNPHEIKNLLGSISPEIQEKAPDAYKKMVKLFNLTKASLNSSSITDSLSNQIEQIEGFLSLEKSMLIEPLSYSIQNKIENQEIEIPRLLLKNLVENCVKHGIKGKENGGLIAVNIAQENNFVIIEVDDTGKGRQNAISLDSGIGTSTYQKLFAALNQKNKDKASFEIIDKQQGTKVKVIIPLDYKYL